MTENLTKRQRDILAFIQAETARRGIPPTVREIAAHFGIASPNGAACHLKALEEKGYIKKEPGLSRGMSLLPKRPEEESGRQAGYPLVGEVAAGGPKLAVQEEGEALTLEDASGARPGDFLLKVKGDSMAGAGINPGDIAVVRPDGIVNNGDIAVVMVGEEEATIKRYYIEKSGVIRLVPENPAYETLVVDPSHTAVSIAGKVVGVIRRY